ncbi:MAG: HAD family hydrolase [Erysipelotrichaceae bacterium]|nr:HAD family hydrolase [Erysipelotrichaceae bacterium]
MKTILFDLDGTLLRMDEDAFIKAYFGTMAKKMTGYGYDPENLVSVIWEGLKAMISNDGSMTNEEKFWEVFLYHYPEKDRDKEEEIFLDYYLHDFDQVSAVAASYEGVRDLITSLKKKGHRVVLATNPVFPAPATRKRIAWAGLSPEDFELYTTYENSSSCKPNLLYYEEVLKKLNEVPENCVMVGNDVEEDMIARELGMDVFLLTEHLLNRKGKDISVYPNGDFEALKEYLENRP